MSWNAASRLQASPPSCLPGRLRRLQPKMSRFIAGIIASKTTVTTAGDELSGYLASYGWAAGLALAAGIVMLCLSPLLNRLSRAG